MFSIFPTISILDTLDKSGKDAYATSSMAVTVSRVPDTLFDKSAPAPVVYAPPVFAPPPVPAATVSRAASIKASVDPLPIARSGSRISTTKAKIDRSSSLSKKGKSGKLGKTVLSRKNKSNHGLFPAARLKRKIK